MYPHTPTYTEQLNKIIEDNKPVEADIIKEYIDKHNTKMMDEGERYYFNENDIKNRKIYTVQNGEKVVDHEATNNKIPSGWHKLLVDQKVSYLVGSPVTIGYEDETDIQPLLDLLGDDFDDTLPELVKGSSNKGKEWLHPFIDENGDFDYMIVPAQEFIPIYDNTKRRKIVGGIRHYNLDHDDITKVEFWDSQQVTYYEIINGGIHFDSSIENNPAPHFYYGDTGYSWSKEGIEAVPFIEFKNNEESVSDLTFYKDLIDAFDKTMSDTTNTLEDVQNFIYVLKGYEGQDLEEFMTNLKRYKVISVSDEQGAGVETVRGEVPVDATESHLNRLRENIFQFGQGVDVGTDKFGNSPSGIALKFLFSLLDMKVDVLERKFTQALKQFMWYVVEYAAIAREGEFDNSKIKFTFNKSKLMNEVEQAQIAQNSMGVISKKTIIRNHPWVQDEQAEKEQLDEEQNEVNLDIPLGEGNE